MLYLPEKVINTTKALGLFIVAVSMLTAYTGLLAIISIIVFKSVLG